MADKQGVLKVLNEVDYRDGARLVEVEVTGRTLANLLGKKGNAMYRKTPLYLEGTMDYSSNEYRVKGTSINTTIGKFTAVANKYYIYLAEILHGLGAGNTEICISDSNQRGSSTNSWELSAIKYTTTTTKDVSVQIRGFNRPADLVSSVRGLRVYEVTKEEYDYFVGFDSNMIKYLNQKYPYVEDAQLIRNPYISSTENHLRGECPLLHCSYDPSSGYENSGVGQNRALLRTSNTLEPNKTYTLSSDNDLSYLGDIEVRICLYSNYNQSFDYDTDWGTKFLGQTSFTTPKLAKFAKIAIRKPSNAPFSKEDYLKLSKEKFCLVEGNSKKLSSECINSRVAFETTLGSGESIKRDSSNDYFVDSLWEEVVLSGGGKISAFKSSPGYTILLFHSIVLDTNSAVDPNYLRNYAYLARHDGELLPTHQEGIDGTWGTKGTWHFGGAGANSKNPLYVSVPNTLTGWGDTYLPSGDEIVAYLLGYRMFPSKANGYQELYTGTGAKCWGKFYSGLGAVAKTGNSLCDLVSNTDNLTCPTVMNDMGYIPNKVIYRKVLPITKKVKSYGNLLKRSTSNISIGSGLVLSELFTSKVNFNPTIINGAGSELDSLNKVCDILSAYDRVSEEYLPVISQKLDDNSNIYRYGPCKYHSRTHYPTLLIDYLMLLDYTVTNYDYQLKISENSKDLLEDLLLESSKSNKEFNKYIKLLDEYQLASKVSNPNLLINSNFQVWQRGESFSESKREHYCADRWRLFSDAVKLSVTRPGPTGIKIAYESADYFNLWQVMEIPKEYYGKTVTFSVKLKSSNPVKLVISRSVNNDLIVLDFDSNSDFQVIKATTKLENLATTTFSILTRGSGGLLEIEWAKVELGGIATPYVAKTYTEEYTACQRYFQLVPFKHTVTRSTNLIQLSIKFNPRMRANPSIMIVRDMSDLTPHVMDDFSAGQINLTNYVASVLSPSYLYYFSGVTSNPPIAVGMVLGAVVQADAELY